jgi:hypothetical protein
MKVGKTLTELAAEIQRQAESKRDYVAPAQKLELQVVEQTPVLAMHNGRVNQYGITNSAHDQIASRLEIPRTYYDRLRADSPPLLATNVNHWLQKSPAKYMVRTLDGNARALLSDRYRPLDNYDLAETVLPRMINAGCNVESCDLTESRLYLKAVTQRITAEVKVGDVVQAGVIVSNSEIGMGAIKVEPLIYKLSCLNGAIVNTLAMKRTHVGRRAAEAFIELEGAERYFRDETRIADDRAFWLKIGDVVQAMLDETTFKGIVARWTEATEQKITVDPVEVVERTAKRFNLNDGERSGVLTHLIQGGDLSAYGLMNAITRVAQDVESYDRSTELERVGPQVLELPRQAWRELAEVK